MLDNPRDPDFNAQPLICKVAEILRQAEGRMSLGAFMDRPGIKGIHGSDEVHDALAALVNGGCADRTSRAGGRVLFQFAKMPTPPPLPPPAAAAAPRQASLKGRVLAAVPVAPGSLGTKELHERLPGDGFPSVQTTLSLLRGAGLVIHDNGRPARWSRPAPVAQKVGKLELKRRTLRRLEELLEPSIASVLAEIRLDLEAA